MFVFSGALTLSFEDIKPLSMHSFNTRDFQVINGMNELLPIQNPCSCLKLILAVSRIRCKATGKDIKK